MKAETTMKDANAAGRELPKMAILAIAKTAPIVMDSVNRSIAPLSSRVLGHVREWAEEDVAYNDPYDGYSLSATDSGIAFLVPRYENAGLLVFKFTALFGFVTLLLIPFGDPFFGDFFAELFAQIAITGLFCSVIAATVTRNMPDYGSVIEVRPEGLTLNGGNFFPREDIRGISFRQEEGRETRCLQIIFGVKPMLLAERMELITSQVFEADFNKATRRLWQMRD